MPLFVTVDRNSLKFRPPVHVSCHAAGLDATCSRVDVIMLEKSCPMIMKSCFARTNKLYKVEENLRKECRS